MLKLNSELDLRKMPTLNPVHPERDCEERAGAVEGWEGLGVGILRKSSFEQFFLDLRKTKTAQANLRG